MERSINPAACLEELMSKVEQRYRGDERDIINPFAFIERFYVRDHVFT
jgi:hypothetical protein